MKHLWIIMVAAACGGGSSTAIDAPAGPGSAGFDTPTVSVHANTQNTDGSWTDVGSADLSCLGSASTDTATTVDVALSTAVLDFQTQDPVGGAMVTAFQGLTYTSPFDTQTADGSGNVTVTIPSGTTRFGFQMTASTQFPTFLLNQKVDPSTPTQTLDKIQSVSANTADTLPALIGQERTVGTGVVAGTLRDCQNREMSGFVVTVSSTPTTATPLPGSEAYYFSPIEMPLPVRHNVADYATGNGTFMAIQVPVADSVYIQAWGFPTDAAIGSAGAMTLLSQLTAPSVADTVTTGSFEPLRQQ